MAGPPDAEILAIGRSIHAAMPSAARHPLRALDARAMDLATADADLRAALFRFVDVVPACRSVDDVVAHLTGFLGEVDERPPPIDVALRMGATRAGRQALGRAAAAGVRHMAHRFIVGASAADAAGTLTALWRDGIATSVDLLGEATVTPAEAERYAARCAEALEALTAIYRPLPARPVLEHDAVGPVARANLSVKVSALTPLLRPDAPERGKRDAGPRLRELLRAARHLGAHLHIDMESYDSREAIVELVLELLSEPEFADGPSAGIVLQAYLRDAPETLDLVESWARRDATGRAARGPARQGRVLGSRGRRGAPARLERAGVRGEGRERPRVRAPHGAAPGDAPARARRDRLAQPPLGRPRDRRQPRGRRARRRPRAPDPPRPRRRSRAGARPVGLPRARLLPRRRPRVGHGVPRRRLLENTANESFLAAEQGGAAIEDLLLARP